MYESSSWSKRGNRWASERFKIYYKAFERWHNTKSCQTINMWRHCVIKITNEKINNLKTFINYKIVQMICARFFKILEKSESTSLHHSIWQMWKCHSCLNKVCLIFLLMFIIRYDVTFTIYNVVLIANNLPNCTGLRRKVKLIHSFSTTSS